jgi:transcriptional/translational regulatory protein YebC/TACO1
MRTLEQVRICPVQPSGNLCESGLVEPMFVRCGWVFSRPRALAPSRTSAG